MEMQLNLPRKLLDFVDENRGTLSRQVFILKLVSERANTDSHNGDNDGITTNCKRIKPEIYFNLFIFIVLKISV
jgi:hypothetical protein